MTRLHWSVAPALWLALSVFGGHVALAAEGDLTREQALAALKQPAANARYAALTRLGEVGTAHDVDSLLPLLHDEDSNARDEAERAILRIWTRSGDANIDAMLTRGTREMSERNIQRALSTFSEVIRLKPEFAEGWNKRATLYFMTGDYLKSLQDCGEVLQRNPVHFGALAGYGQIYIELKQYERALEYFQRAININPNMVTVSNTMEKLERTIQRGKDNQI